MKRRTAREITLMALFQMDVGKLEKNEAYKNVLNENEEDPFLKMLFFGIADHLQKLDENIGKHLDRWTIDRLANVDRNILRMAAYELLYLDEIPDSVTINEAIEIAKKYGDEHSPKFINGVLSNIKNSQETKTEDESV